MVFILAKDIISLYNVNSFTNERKLQFCFLWHKQLEFVNEEIRSKYYYYDLKVHKELFINGNPRGKI